MTPDRFRNINKAAKGRPESPPKVKSEIRKYGISASPGIVIGTAFLRDSELLVVPRTKLTKVQVKAEIKKFQEILAETRGELLGIKSHIAEQMGDDHAKIFDSHLMILDDVLVVEDTVDLIRKERMNAAGKGTNWSAVACRAFEARLAEIAAAKKKKDIEDVVQRLRGSRLRRDDEM